ncbi:MAG: (S)-ureidoglycine aminohydrolase [Enterobacteriaceae bacterium]
MGYLNNNVGYPKDILSSRAVIRKESYAIIPPDGLVCNVIPGFEHCDVTILSSPKLGASFVDYLVTLQANGQNQQGFGDEEIEVLAYVIDGKVNVSAQGQNHTLDKGGYIYCPPGVKLCFENSNSGNKSQLFLYKRRYNRIPGQEPWLITGNVNQLEKIAYEGMDNVMLQDLLPKEIAFDMNFHILTFKPGASHGYIETHIQEHGAYILTGAGVYNLDNEWVPVKKGDYLFMAAYVHQAGYAVGDEEFSYIYSKDCHRDVTL